MDIAAKRISFLHCLLRLFSVDFRLHLWQNCFYPLIGKTWSLVLSNEIRLCPLYLFFHTQFFALFDFQWARTHAWVRFSKPKFWNGGDDGNRTHDPLLAGQVLSQLSYTPILNMVCSFLRFFEIRERISPFSSSCQHWAIFPCSFPQSIFATAELNFCVRNGNRWTLCVYNTD